jgi:glycine oxidase
MRVAVIGAGVVGLWQALTLARAGHAVTVHAHARPGASAIAGAMLAPWCEAEDAPELEEAGIAALGRWREAGVGAAFRGTLVAAGARDRSELQRFGQRTRGHRAVARGEIESLESDLGGRFDAALFYAGEGHVEPAVALPALRIRAEAAGARFADPEKEPDADAVVDCRGLAAASDLPELRGVRGEMAVVETSEIALTRPVRLLHPRHPLYVVPWAGGRYMVGATVIESASEAPVTVRSALDLLGLAYALHPAFGEARIIAMQAAARPAFPGNLPRIVPEGGRIHVNGAFRHGYLLAPMLAEAVTAHLAGGPIPALFR